MMKTPGMTIDETDVEAMMNKKKYKVTFEVIIEVEAINESDAAEQAEKEWNKGDFERHSMVEEVLRRR